MKCKRILHHCAWILLIVSLFLFIGCVSVPNTVKHGLILDTNSSTGVLENGLTYYVYPTDIQEDMVKIQFTVNTGSLYEKEEERGYAHFIEHMAFASTEKYQKKDFKEMERDLGITFGVHSNAYTDYRIVNYHLEVQDLTEQRLNMAFDILSQRALYVVFNQKEVETERGVIFSEKAMRSADSFWDRYFFYHDTILEGTRYPERSPIGLDSTLEAATPESLKALYERYYIPSNMAVSVIGDIDTEEALVFIKNYFGKNDTGDGAREVLPAEEPNIEEKRLHGFYDTSIKNPSIRVAYVKRDEQINKDIHFMKEQAIEYAISSLLEKTFDRYVLEHKDTRLIDMWFYVSIIDNQFKNPMLNIEYKKEHTEEAIVEAQNFVSNFSEYLNTEEGLDGVREELRQILYKYSERSDPSLDEIGNATAYHYIYGEPIIDLEKNLKKIKREIFKELSNARVKNIFDFMYNKEKNLHAFLFVGDHNKNIIDENNVPVSEIALERIFEKNSSNAEFIGATKEAFLEDIVGDPKPGEIVHSKFDKNTQIHTWTFENGHVVKFTKFVPNDSDASQLAIRTYNKSLKYNFIQRGNVARVAAELLNFTTVDGELIPNIFQKYNPTIHVGDSSVFLVSNRKDDYTNMFQLLHLAFTKISYPQEELERTKAIAKDTFEAELEDPLAYTFNALNDYLTKHYKYSYDVFDSSLIDDVDYTTIQDYQREFFQAAGTVFTIVGNISPSRAKKLAKKWIGSLETEESTPIDWDAEFYPSDPTYSETLTRRDDKDISYVIYGTHEKEPLNTPVYPRKAMVARIAAEYISYHLGNTLREELGGSYFVYADIHQRFNEIPETLFFVYFPVDVSQAEFAIKELHSTLDALLPLDEDVIADSRDIIKKQVEEEYVSQSVKTVLSNITNNLAIRIPIYPEKEDYLSEFDTITNKEVSVMIQEVLAFDNFTIISVPKAGE